MAYPQAPWTLQGYAIQTLQLIDVARVRPLIPPEFDIISVLPGKTVGGVYLSKYGQGSVLEYSELIVAAGLVRYSGKIGGWISHIYVDNPDSVAGGREIWGLPKELAQFNWENGDRVVVTQEGKLLCSLNYGQPSFRWHFPLKGNVFSTLNASILSFMGEFEARVGLISGQIVVPPESPFASMDLDQSWLTFYADSLRLVAGVPAIVGHRESVYSYQ